MNRFGRLLLNALVAGAVMALLVVRCSPEPVSGGGTEGGNVVSGVFNEDGGRVSAKVFLMPSEYNPGAVDKGEHVVSSFTAANGGYSFDHVPQGRYSIEAIDTVNGKRSLVTGVAVSGEDVRIPDDTLRVPGTLMVFRPRNDATGYIYLPGTTICARFTDTTRFAMVNAPSATPLPPICYATLSDPAAAVVRYDTRAVAGDTTVVANAGWKYARRFFLNTKATGADVPRDVAGIPVAVRLTKDNFDFLQAQPGGNDIRFSRSDTVRLPFDIERWDAANQQAEIWVRIDTVFGNNNLQSVTMYWGNASADNGSNGAAVFDTSAGFQGVWHMGDVSEDSVYDVTFNRYHGVSPDTALPSSVGGVIGNCRQFDGRADFITMPNTAASRLNMQQDGNYSVSAWVSADTFIAQQQTLVSKGRYQFFLWIDSISWKFWEYQDRAGWESSAQKATLRQWILLTAVRNGAKQCLYVNGVAADSIRSISATAARNTSSDLNIGQAHELETTIKEYASLCYFRGKIDEICISNVSRSSDWIKLCYMNQREDDKLVIFK